MIEIITIPFDTLNVSAQAEMILKRVDELNKEGYEKVGITYSANQAQTKKINETYAQKRWFTGTSGANQAKVIARIEELLGNKYSHLRGIFQIVPITTMDYEQPNFTAKDSDVQKSLDKADEFIKKGFYLLGWANQNTPHGHVAIGGAMSKKAQTPVQKQMIQNWIMKVFTQNQNSELTIRSTKIAVQTSTKSEPCAENISKNSNPNIHLEHDNGDSRSAILVHSDPNIKKLQSFCAQQKTRLNGTSAYDSLNSFQKTASQIILSQKCPLEKKRLLNQCAHETFQHRDYIPRLLADALLLISSLALVGLTVGLARVLKGYNFFFSAEKTKREAEFNKLVDEIINCGNLSS